MNQFVSFKVHVEGGRVNNFVCMLADNGFTNVTVQCPVFPDGGPPLPFVQRPPENVEEDYGDDMKLFDPSIDDQLTQTKMPLIEQHATKGQAKKRISVKLEHNERTVKKREASDRFMSTQHKKQRAVTPDEGHFISRLDENEPHFINHNGLRRSTRLAVKTEVITPPATPVRVRSPTPVAANYFLGAPNANNSNYDDDIDQVDVKPIIKDLKDSNYVRCRDCGSLAKRQRPRQAYHVMARHTKERNLECPICGHQTVRKNTMAIHMRNIHNSEDAPLDIVTDKKRHIWADAMKRCYPEFADDTGFYEPKLKVY